MKITLKWLKKKNACEEAVVAWKHKGCESDPVKVVQLAMEMDRFDLANWFIVRTMGYKQYVSYAVFAAEQVIHIYEKKYPNDKRPRNAIEAAKKCAASPTKKNKASAADASATYAAYDAASATYAAAAYAAYDAAYDSKKELQKKIIEYGITLISD